MEIFPKCVKCGDGDIIPLSDTSVGQAPASVTFKAWVCTNPECGYNVRFKNGEIIINAPITNGAALR